MPPITWQNIRYSNPAEAAQPMALATQAANNALAPLSAALGKMETTQDYNWQNQKTNNTNDARQIIMSQFTDPTDLANGMKDGRVDALLNAHGAQINKPALLDFLDQRGDVLRQRGINQIKYQDAMRDDSTAADVDKLTQSRYEKDPVKAAQMAQEASASLADKGYRHFGDQAALADQHERMLIERQHVDRASDDTHSKTLNDILVNNKNAESSRIQANAAMAGVGVQREGVAVQRAGLLQNFSSKVDQELLSTQIAKNKLTPIGAASEEGGTIIDKAIAGLPDPVARQNAAKAAADFIAANPNAPASAVASAATAINQRWWRSDSQIRDEVTQNMAKLATAAQQDNSSQSKNEARQTLQENIDRLREVQKTTDANVYANIFSDKTNGVRPGDKLPVTVPNPGLGDGASKPVVAEQAAAAAQPAVAYAPTKDIADGSNPLVSPEVQQANADLKMLKTNPPKNMTVTDKLLKIRQAELTIENATREALAKKALHDARSAAPPGIDASMVHKFVSNYGMNGQY